MENGKIERKIALKDWKALWKMEKWKGKFNRT